MVCDVNQRETFFLWREHTATVVRVLTDAELQRFVPARTVTVRLEPGESKSVQVGPREYLTVRRLRS